MAQKRSELLKNSDYLSNLTTGLGLNSSHLESEKPVEKPVEIQAPVSVPEIAVQTNKAGKGSEAFKLEAGGEKPKELTSKKQVKRVNLEITSDKRRTAGFHIFPEYENAIEAIRMNGHYKNKGMALEMLVNFYLSHIESDKKDNIMKIMASPKEPEEW